MGKSSANRKALKLEECIEMIEKKKMPIRQYNWAHPKAMLSSENRQKLLDWFASIK